MIKLYCDCCGKEIDSKFPRKVIEDSIWGQENIYCENCRVEIRKLEIWQEEKYIELQNRIKKEFKEELYKKIKILRNG